jgi:hypothetical protein
MKKAYEILDSLFGRKRRALSSHIALTGCLQKRSSHPFIIQVEWVMSGTG